jgi:hypothetical protein
MGATSATSRYPSALKKDDVDTRPGLDPNTAASEIQAGWRLLYRNEERAKLLAT